MNIASGSRVSWINQYKQKNPNKFGFFFVCGFRRYNKKCGQLKSITKKEVENAFSFGLKKISYQPYMAKAVKKAIIEVYDERKNEIHSNFGSLKLQLENLKAEKDKLIEMKKKELLDNEDFREEMDKVKIMMSDKRGRLLNCNEDGFDVKKNLDKVFDFMCNLPDFY